jgi:hypothetical protein
LINLAGWLVNSEIKCNDITNLSKTGGRRRTDDRGAKFTESLATCPCFPTNNESFDQSLSCVTAPSSAYASLAPLETDTETVMLHAENQDRLYLIAQSEEQQNLVGSLAFNVQDRHWLVYCALGGHQHADLPEMDLLTGVSVLDFYSEAA